MEQFSIKTGHLSNEIKQEANTQLFPEVCKTKEHLLKGDAAGNDFLGWVNLPEEIDQKELARLKADVERLAGKSKVFVVIGIGGSYLGARMVIEALQSEFLHLGPHPLAHPL